MRTVSLEYNEEEQEGNRSKETASLGAWAQETSHGHDIRSMTSTRRYGCISVKAPYGGHQGCLA